MLSLDVESSFIPYGICCSLVDINSSRERWQRPKSTPINLKSESMVPKSYLLHFLLYNNNNILSVITQVGSREGRVYADLIFTSWR